MAIPESDCKVSADPVRLQQVFWNLLSNAIKFTPRGGKISVNLKVIENGTGKRAQVQVIDTGVGIKREFIGQVFERFNQADSSTTRTYGGLGLGLAIVKSLVGMQSGSVSVESEGQGKGSIFTVMLPLVQESNFADRNPSVSTRQTPSIKGVRVLVVDDSRDNLDLFSVMLKSLGARVYSVESAGEAMAAFSHFKPDVLLSDISMPGEDGYSLIRRVRQLTEDQGGKIPAIALTAYAGTDNIQKTLAAGFSAHIAKPVEKTNLARVIASVMI
jgi:CheY-like chemotaxis protein